jgi:dTDP-4-amino-4,6-dideoxygalactose transaminase
VIPFNKPVSLGTELKAIAVALEENGFSAGGGPFGKQCEQMLESLLGQRTLLVSSATHALELAAHLLDIQPGDEFVVPSFTFVSTANAFVLRGARPVFADVDRNGNLDLSEVSKLLGRRTKAIVPVHYAGNSCDLPALLQLAGSIPVVEDAAQAIGASFGGKPLGTFGACGAFSFHETKNIGCGEGGALTLRSPELIDRAEYYRDKGTNRRKFLDGLVDKYTWIDVGSSLVLSDVNAAYLSTQLLELPRIAARRRQMWERYAREIEPAVVRAGGYVVRGSPENLPNHHLFGIVFGEAGQRSRFISAMRADGVTTPFHYVALHRSPMGERLHDGRKLPNTDRLSSCLVRMPLFFNLSDADQSIVIDATLRFLRTL